MRTKDALRDMAQLLDRIWVALIVRDPGTSLSADAYDGLRKQVAAAAQQRFAHLVQLAQFREALERSADVASLRNLVAEWMEQAGLDLVDDPGRPELYEVVAGSGAAREVIAPAFVDRATNRVIKQGTAKAFDPSSAESGDGESQTSEPSEELDR